MVGDRGSGESRHADQQGDDQDAIAKYRSHMPSHSLLKCGNLRWLIGSMIVNTRRVFIT
jgi:hypothetical protein